MRHVALNVHDPQISKEFYTRVLKMTVEWEPDPDNVYLTSGGQDNLAIHRIMDTASTLSTSQKLDHIGFAVATPGDVDQWYEWVKSNGVRIVKEIKTHRDGARSFYFSDPDGVIIQLIFHPPIAKTK